MIKIVGNDLQMNFNRYKIYSIKPYIELMRLNSPIGIYLLLWPAFWSIGLTINDEIPILTFIMFGLGAIIMRSAGCVINDIVDHKIDAQVERTKKRPIPSGRVNLVEASLLAAFLLIIGFYILLNLSSTARNLGYLIIIPIIIYPFIKRFSYWPQAFLAITFNWGALMGWAAIRDEISTPAVLIYIASVTWTLGYDTIYGHQDKEDDRKIGVKSTSLKLGSNTRKFLYLFYGITIISLWVVGVMLDWGLIYYICLFVGAGQLIWQASSVNLDNPDDCKGKFLSNKYFGLIIFIGIMTRIVLGL